MVALLAGVLIIVSALSVDLGNAWSRGRIVQKQADISALAAGSLLPLSSTDARTDNNSKSDFAALAVTYLNDNVAAGQDVAVASELLDDDYSNGELEFFTDDGTACDNECTQLTLTPPQAYVDFGLAGAVSPGTNVTRSATVRAFSELPPKEKIVPFWLPSGCGYGPVDADTTQGHGPNPRPAPAWAAKAPMAAAAAAPIPISPVGTHTLSNPSLTYTIAYNASLEFQHLKITNVTNTTTKATIRAIAPNGESFTEYASADVKSNASQFNVANFTVATELSATPGEWKLYALITDDGVVKYSSNYISITVGPNPASPTATTSSPTGTGTATGTGTGTGTATGTTSATATSTTTSIPVGCVGQDRGNFGQLNSVRAVSGENNNSVRLAYNLAKGLDHLPIPYVFADIQKECADKNGNNKLPLGQLDNVSRAGNNCIIAEEGNDGPQIYKGLISGIGSAPGRLDVVNGATKTGCNGGANRSIGTYTINNDVLSCYLTGGATLTDLTAETGVEDNMLDDAVKDSPRFCWLPVVVATDRAQKGYQPLVEYLPAFITDESTTTAATSNNGLEINGNSVSKLRMFVFNPEALGPDQQSPDIDYDPVLGVANVRLVG
ncbi:hypothetical protein GCM10009623_04960 [Nocardioides aestuarii]